MNNEWKNKKKGVTKISSHKFYRVCSTSLTTNWKSGIYVLSDMQHIELQDTLTRI